MVIMDIQNSEVLLVEKGCFTTHNFSSDGSCFGACWNGGIHLWNYNDNHYIPWRQISSQWTHNLILFSPNLSSIVVRHGDNLGLWNLNHSPTAHTTHISQLKIISHSGI